MRDALSPGLHHYTREVDGRVVRYHLRVEADGSGALIANASAVARLSPSGVALAYALLRDRPREAHRRAQRGFRGASPERVEEDLRRLREVLDELAEPRGRYPLLGLDDPESTLHRRTLSAPLAADLVAADVERTAPILRRLWEVGIPQVVLGLPERAQTAQLVRLVERAEDLGLVCGVRARASDLVAGRALDDLAAAGLDHLDVYWAGPDDRTHDALLGDGDLARAREVVARCHSLELCPVAVTPLVTSTLLDLDDMAADLAERRVGAWTVFAIAGADGGGGQVLGQRELRQAAATAEELSDRHGLNLLWAPPVERDPDGAVAAQAARGPRTTGEAGVRIEPDGAVVPPVGPPTGAGDLLRDDWQAVWAGEAFRSWRESVEAPARCDACPGLAVCSAGCPADPGTWARTSGGER